MAVDPMNMALFYAEPSSHPPAALGGSRHPWTLATSENLAVRRRLPRKTSDGEENTEVDDHRRPWKPAVRELPPTFQKGVRSLLKTPSSRSPPITPPD
ncbi:hypothetical protein EVAR_99723_1 [Eumeta japonica]|uniref:Uncharacterized protein n=1 Tax=Eumeta variegata TaxID=151549 RepID=A0A4C1SL27_EUMVA|nr:hypothetical protein EVAR_99723_1 [Eumeta japonica]